MQQTIHTPDATYEPYASPNGALGFRVLLPSGAVRYVYLNPSGDSDDGIPNVFLYEGTTGDPAEDTPVTYLDITAESEDYGTNGDSRPADSGICGSDA